jgi:cysteine desulfurase
MTERTVYLDFAATTPVDEAVAAEMRSCMGPDGEYANPSSTHRAGRAAARRVAEARAEVAARIGAAASSIVFTSGATEADNMALQGAMLAGRARGRHLVTSMTEHKAVLDTAAALEARGFGVSYVGCDASGLIDIERIDAAITEETLLVSIMHVNNETGVVQDIGSIGERCRRRGVLFHVDAAQSIGKLDLRVDELPLDLVSLTAHKVHGPKGVGALYLAPGVALSPLIFGGEQEQGLRPGTLPTQQIVGMGKAYALADPAADGPALKRLKDHLWAGLSAIPDVRLNGHTERSAPHVLNVSFAGVSGESLRLAIDEIYVSAGSACKAETLESSHVLSAMGLSDAMAESALRFSVGRQTTAEEIDYVVGRVAEEVGRLRALAPDAPAWCRA